MDSLVQENVVEHRDSVMGEEKKELVVWQQVMKTIENRVPKGGMFTIQDISNELPGLSPHHIKTSLEILSKKGISRTGIGLFHFEDAGVVNEEEETLRPISYEILVPFLRSFIFDENDAEDIQQEMQKFGLNYSMSEIQNCILEIEANVTDSSSSKDRNFENCILEKPKNGPTAYKLFSDYYRQEISQKFPTFSRGEIREKLKSLWKDANVEEKNKFEELAFPLREERKKLIEIWKQQNPKNENRLKKKQKQESEEENKEKISENIFDIQSRNDSGLLETIAVSKSSKRTSRDSDDGDSCGSQIKKYSSERSHSAPNVIEFCERNGIDIETNKEQKPKTVIKPLFLGRRQQVNDVIRLAQDNESLRNQVRNLETTIATLESQLNCSVEIVNKIKHLLS